MESSQRSIALPVLATSIAIAGLLLLLFPHARVPDGASTGAAAIPESGGREAPDAPDTPDGSDAPQGARRAWPAPAEGPCAFDVPLAFRTYVELALGAEDAAQRSAAIGRPARDILAMPAAELRAIGVLDVSSLALELRRGGAPLAALLRDSLMDHWLACAERAGGRAALRAEALELLERACAPGLVRADPAALELACALASCFTAEDDARQILAVLLPVLGAAREEPALAVERARPPVDLASSFARFPWARRELLALLGASWMDAERRRSFRLALLTARPRFDDWRAALTELSRDCSPAARRAALEVLADLAAPRGADGRPLLAAELLVESIPVELLCAPDAELSLTALELLARHGGRPGRRALQQLLDDPACPRAAILALLEGEDAAGDDR